MKNRDKVRVLINRFGVIIILPVIIFSCSIGSNSDLVPDHSGFYKLPVNQILTYEIEHASTFGTPKYSEYVDILIADKTATGFILELSFNEISKARHGPFYSSRFGKLASLLEACFEVEKNSVIKIAISRNGYCENFKGVEGLQGRIVEVLKSRDPGFRSKIPYDFIEKRFGDDYYRYLVNLFFPDLSDKGSERIGMCYEQTQKNLTQDGETVSFNVDFIFHDSEHLTNELKDFFPEKQCAVTFFNGIPKRTSMYTPEFNRIFMNTGFEYPKWPGEYFIEKIESQLISTKSVEPLKASIWLQLSNQESKRYLLDYTVEAYLAHPKPVVLASIDSLIHIPIDLRNGTQLLRLVFDSADEPFKPDQYEDYAEQIAVYIMPGDSIYIGLNLNPFQIVYFNGDQQIENRILNELRKYGKSGYEEKSIENLRANQEVIRRNQYQLSDDFLYHIDNELTSLQLSFQLDQLRNQMTLQWRDNSVQWSDSLRNFIWHLNNPVGHKSKGYWRFLKSFYYVVVSSRMNFSEIDNYELIQNHFSEWDSKFLSAFFCLWEIEEKGLQLDDKGTSKAMEQYKSDYPRSELVVILEQSLRQYQAFQTGQKIPGFLREIIDQNKQIASNTKDYALSVLRRYPPRFLNANIPPDVVHFVMIHEDLINSKPKVIEKPGEVESAQNVIVGVSEEILNNCDPILNKTLFFNKRWQIVGYCDLHDAVGLSNFYSWPEEKLKENRQVSYTTLLFALSFVVFVSALIILIIRWGAARRNRRLKYERKIHELELKAIRARMNPHFLFNALSSIQSLINQNQLKSANDYLANFGGLVRSFLEQSNQRSVTLAEELEVLKTYIELEQLRFEFDFNIHISEKIDLNVIEIPPLLIQPHLENAVIHGIGPLSGKGLIEVSFNLQEEYLIVIVSDNGFGFSSSGSDQKGNGKGWELTCQRIDFLQKETGLKYSVRRVDNIDGSKGAIVEFKLPIEKS
ncbi:MAG: histidine kinase [Bacteroidota bacterium]|nr:histidine kinase [Bacteroidota bacterium]